MVLYSSQGLGFNRMEIDGDADTSGNAMDIDSASLAGSQQALEFGVTQGLAIRGLYPPPQIPCGVHVESRSIPGVHVDFRQFFFGGSPANFLSRIHVESMWSPAGVQLLHLDNMDSTSEHREYEFTQQDSIWTPHGFIAFNCLMLFII